MVVDHDDLFLWIEGGPLVGVGGERGVEGGEVGVLRPLLVAELIIQPLPPLLLPLRRCLLNIVTPMMCERCYVWGWKDRWTAVSD